MKTKKLLILDTNQINMRKLSLILIVLLSFIYAKAQNPFAEYGYTPKIATLSQGQYNEFFDNDTLVQIGSVLFNTKSKQIVAFIETDTLYSESTLEPDIVSRWISPDPLAEKYLSISPYVYCIDNPIKFIDPDGKDVVILLAKDGAGGYGHMGAVVQDGNGKYYYMTVGNADATAGTSKLLSSGTQGGMSLQPLDAKNMNEAVSLAKQDQNNSPYTDQLQFNTSSSMDKAIFGSAQELQKSVNSGETKYNALTNNCADAVVKVFEKGTGVDLPTGASPKPNDKFASIKEGAGNVQDNLDVKSGKTVVVTIPSTMDNVPARTISVPKIDEQKK